MIKKIAIATLMLCSLSACGKTKLVSVPYMPEPPAILMQAPDELDTIRGNTP